MTKAEILRELENHTGTILSFSERGPWGSNRYRGSCSGWIPAFFINKFHVSHMAEVFAGSGTTYDVCKDMNVAYTGIDLNPNPPRHGIQTMDILDDSMDLPDGFYHADMVFLHPPYPSINGIHYSGAMWKDTIGCAKSDIQEMDFETGMQAVNHAMMRAYNALPAGSYEVCLVGEIRSKGKYRSMYQNLIIPGIMQQTYIKMQHNCMSGTRVYRNQAASPYALIEHEMIAVIKKPSGYEIAYVIPKKYSLDIRDSLSATWKDIIMSIARSSGGILSGDFFYRELEGRKKTLSNPNWKAKIRQTLQQLAQAGLLKHVGIGQWQYITR